MPRIGILKRNAIDMGKTSLFFRFGLSRYFKPEKKHKMKQLYILALVMILGISATANAMAATAPEVTKAENYFAGLKNAKARFIQTAPNGTQQRGTFYLSRPGKLRFEYDPPNDDFIVADGLFIYFYDGVMKQQSNAPISQTLADFLLREKLKLSGDLKVTKILHAPNLVQIFVEQTKEPKSGTLVLGFEEKKEKYELKKWRIIDALGNIVETELFNIEYPEKFKNSAKLFSYQDPKPKGYNK